ncbi:hypothetical protein SLS64_011375 [Diaporthe eres]
MSSPSFYALIAGVGSGIGRATALRFARTYPVVLVARNADSYSGLVDEIKASGGKAIGVAADVSRPDAMRSAFETIQKETKGSKLAAAIYNVNSGFVMKPFLDIKQEELELGLDGTARGFFNFAQQTIPLLLQSVGQSNHPPTLIATGATASTKASANFATFAAGKFALRALSQSIAKEFGPRGIHVAHAIVDGIVDTPFAKKLGLNHDVEDGRISTEAVSIDYYSYLL